MRCSPALTRCRTCSGAPATPPPLPPSPAGAASRCARAKYRSGTVTAECGILAYKRRGIANKLHGMRAQVWDLALAMDAPVCVHRTPSWANKVRPSCALFSPLGPALVVGYSNGTVAVYKHTGLDSDVPAQQQRERLSALVHSTAA